MLHEWANYFAAMAGASAALTGLIFVGISISITKILAIPKLANRGLESLVLLLNILFISSFFLIPGQPLWVLGTEVFMMAVAVWIFTSLLDLHMYKQTEAEYKMLFASNVILTQLSTLPYIIGAIIILYAGPVGIYCVIPGIIFSFIRSVLDAWVLLIEINR